MKNIIFIAPPAAGKGTQSDLLVKKYGYFHISTGDLLREEVASGSNLGEEISKIMKSGGLVSDEIVTELLKNTFTKNRDKAFILDGYPRNLKQANILNDLLNELGISEVVAIYLDMEEDLAMHRALGRITCPNCGRGYNKYEDVRKPKVEWLCDDCNVELTSRSDDNEETFKVRFESYVTNTKPLLDYYENNGILNNVDNSKTPEDTFKQIEEVIL